MSLRGAAFIAGAFEHPRRNIPDRTVQQVHAELAAGALADAGLKLADVDAYYCAGDAPGWLNHNSQPRSGSRPAPHRQVASPNCCK